MLAGGAPEPVHSRSNSLLFIPMPEAINTERIPVLYPSGAFYKYVTQREAHQMIRARTAEGLGTKTKLRRIQLIQGPARPVAGTKYSFDHETDENPVNVFTLRKITHLDRDLFMQVQTDCLGGSKLFGKAFVPNINNPELFAR